MDLEIFEVLIAACIILLSYWFYNRWTKLSIFKRYGISGPKPNILTGNLFQLLRDDKLAVEIQEEWISKYGKVVGYHIGLRPKVLVADLELLKKICIKEFSTFPNRRDESIVNERAAASNMLPNLRGERWKLVRSVVGPTFSAKKMKQMTDTMKQCTDLFLEELEKKANDGNTFDIFKMMQGLTLDVIGRCALAMEIDCQRNPNDSFLNAVRDFFGSLRLTSLRAMIVMFPVLKFLLRIFLKSTKTVKIEDMILKNLEGVLRVRRQDKHGAERIDALQLLLNEAADQSNVLSTAKLSVEKLLTDDEIVANMYVFVLAGYETTSNALACTCHLLAHNQHIQDRLYEQIVDKFGSSLSSEPTYESLNSVPYVEQVLHESMRIYPPVPSFVTRDCPKDVTVDGVTFPGGCEIIAAVWNIHHDADVWPDPWKFDPDRFSPENKRDHHPLAYMAFGTGPRNCIGARFAMLEAKLTIVKLMKKFQLVPGDGSENELPLRDNFIGVNPKDGVWVKAIPRQ